MVQVYADDRVVYDTRLPDTALLGLEVSVLVNKAGTAEIVMPPDHPAYDYFTEYRTVVTVYRDGVLLFRGRALYATDDFYRRRTITCEGERGFLLDGIMRPYLYQDGPAAILADIIGLYNAQVEEFKRFVVGTVTATDPNNYVRLESNKAEQIADTACGQTLGRIRKDVRIGSRIVAQDFLVCHKVAAAAVQASQLLTDGIYTSAVCFHSFLVADVSGIALDGAKLAQQFNCLVNDFSSIFLGTLKRGGQGVTLWNLMLDDKRGPFSRHDGSCKTCYGGVTINSADYKTIVKNSHWFNCAHASSVIKRGARMMKTDTFDMPHGFECQMFLNPDNTVGAVMCNNTGAAQSVVFANDKFTVKYSVPAKSIVSLLWQE